MHGVAHDSVKSSNKFKDPSCSVPVLEVRRQVVVHEIVVALVEREEGVVEVSGRAVTLGFLPLPDCTRKISLNISNFP